MLIVTFLLVSEDVYAYSPVKVAELAKPATVGVYTSMNSDKFYGTGVIISKTGLLLTSTTVVPANAEEINIYFEDHTSLPAHIIESSPTTQSVLLQIENPTARTFPFLPLQSAMPILGEKVYTLGNANNMIKLGDGVSFSAGVVSGIYPVAISDISNAKLNTLEVIETDAAVNDGQDGGALINSSAEIIGIISKDYSTLRWQGTAIPIHNIIKDIAALSQDVTINIQHQRQESPNPVFTTPAAAISPNLVSIRVERLYPPEELEFPNWLKYKAGITEWDSMDESEQRRIIVDFFSTERLVSANQMLRRPPTAVTGLLISADGYILTSAFNIESGDSVYIDRNSGEIRQTKYSGNMDKFIAQAQENVEKISNRVVALEVTLSDGRTFSAGIKGFSTPLGLALLKIEPTEPLPFFDLTLNQSNPKLGEEIAVLGANQTTYTINTGIVSAPARNNGTYFQVDALLNYGNSGGPIINNEGKILGIATRPLTPSPVSGSILPFTHLPNTIENDFPALSSFSNTPNSGVSMGVNASKIITALPELMNGEGINNSEFLSLGIAPSAQDPYSSKIVVGNISKGSPADLAGFKTGDIISKMDGIAVSSWSDIFKYIAQKRENQVVIFQIKRPLEEPHLLLNGKKVSNAVELYDFIKSSKDGAKISGYVSSPGINQKLYVTLKH